MDRLGTPFLTTKEQGTGLGLAVCYGIAARHDASIDVVTNSQGTTFLVKFKLKSFDLN
nr:ATP-binding protein [Desulfosporosinus acididurans]